MAQFIRGTFAVVKDVLSLLVFAAGCDGGALPAGEGDGAMPPARDLAEPVFTDGPPDPCAGDDGGSPICGTPCTPECPADCLGPSNNLPFPLATDPMPDPNENDNQVIRDQFCQVGSYENGLVQLMHRCR